MDDPSIQRQDPRQAQATDGAPAPARSGGAPAAPPPPPPGSSATVSAPSDTEFPAWKVGDLDSNNVKITYIYAATKKYLIYEADKQVRYALPDDYSVAAPLRKRACGLGGLRSSIEGMRADPSISERESVRAGRELAWAYGLAFEDTGEPPTEVPKDILTRVDARLRSLVQSSSRKQYAFANAQAFCLIELVLLLFVAALGGGAADTTRAAFLHYAAFGMFGALGAFLSVIAGIRSIDIDINLSNWEHIFAGATRILIGLIGAWIVALTLDSGLIDPTFGNMHSEAAGATKDIGFPAHYAIYFILTFIGGFSQTLVPNLLKRGEDAVGSEDKSPATTGPIVRGVKP